MLHFGFFYLQVTFAMPDLPFDQMKSVSSGSSRVGQSNLLRAPSAAPGKHHRGTEIFIYAYSRENWT